MTLDIFSWKIKDLSKGLRFRLEEIFQMKYAVHWDNTGVQILMTHLLMEYTELTHRTQVQGTNEHHFKCFSAQHKQLASASSPFGGYT